MTIHQREHLLHEAEASLAKHPTLKTLAQSTVVVKYGGAAMEDPDVKESVARQVAVLHALGVYVVVVHGAGNEIGRWSKRLGLTPQFIAGCRVTDDDTMAVSEMVLSGLVNSDLTSRISRRGVPALGISGRSASLTLAKRSVGPHGEYLGRVGTLCEVNCQAFETLFSQRYFPVLACISEDKEGNPLNLNGDYFAASLAAHLKAPWCVFLTNVDGVRRSGEVIPSMTSQEARDLVALKIVTDGMIPKVESAVSACEQGAGRSVIINAALPDSLLRTLAGEAGVGTVFTSEST